MNFPIINKQKCYAVEENEKKCGNRLLLHLVLFETS